VQLLEEILLALTLLTYLAAAILFGFGLAYRQRRAEAVGVVALVMGLVFHTAVLVTRSVEIGRPPLSDLYESLLFMAWCTALLFLLVHRRFRVSAAGLILIPVAFFMVAVAAVLYQPPMELAEPLNSHWLALHVGVSLLGYSAFVVAFASGFFYVVQEDLLKKRYRQVRSLILTLCIALGTGMGLYVGYLLAAPTLFEDAAGRRVYAYSQSDLILIGLGTLAGLGLSILIGWAAARGAARPSFANRLPALHLLDQMSYRAILLGFGLLAVGIVSGALWSKSAWGSWWIWDPKETWALLAWLFYGGYLGLRGLANWRGRNGALLAMAGLFLILFTFLGVKLFVPGKHDFN